MKNCSAKTSTGSRLMKGYIQWGGPPFLTEEVVVKHDYRDRYLLHYWNRWRRIHVQVNRLYVVIDGEKVTVQIEGNPL